MPTKASHFTNLYKSAEVESRTQGSGPRPRRQKNFEIKAKDRPSRGQGPRTQTQVFSKKKMVFKNFFSGDLYLRKPKKKSLQIFCKVSGVFQQNFNGSKVVLSSSRGQGNLQGLEASRPRPRTSKCVLEAKDVLDDSPLQISYVIFTLHYNMWVAGDPSTTLCPICLQIYS